MREQGALPPQAPHGQPAGRSHNRKQAPRMIRNILTTLALAATVSTVGLATAGLASAAPAPTAAPVTASAHPGGVKWETVKLPSPAKCGVIRPAC